MAAIPSDRAAAGSSCFRARPPMVNDAEIGNPGAGCDADEGGSCRRQFSPTSAVHLGGAQVERDVAQRAHSGECFRNAGAACREKVVQTGTG